MNIFSLLAQDSAGDAAGLAVFGGMMMMGLVVGLITYLLLAFSLFTIGKKQGYANSFFAFIPILNLWMIVEISGKEWWWLLLCFVPYVGIIPFIIIMVAFAEKIGKPVWMGVLGCIPCLMLIAWPMMAFGKD